MKIQNIRYSAVLLIGIAMIGTLIAGCGKKEDAEAEFPAFDNEEIVQAYYAEHSDFFRFKEASDLPGNLDWEDGNELPDIGSPKAKKGGVSYGRILDFPRTLRTIGPDSNGSFRRYILDDNVMNFAKRHPNVTKTRSIGFHYFPGVADRWAVNMEAKTVYVHIDDEAEWSNGDPITTDDVAFMFYFYQSEHHKQIWYHDWYGFGINYENLTIYDEKTFSIKLVERRPDLLSRVLELNPMPREFFREYGEDYIDRYQWRNVPTSGAYYVEADDIKKGRSIALTRKVDWWAKDRKFWRNRYNFDKVVMTVVRDTPKALEMFLKGELDAFPLSLAEYWYDKVSDDNPNVQDGYIKKATFFNQYPRPTYGFWMNESKPLLDNNDIRVGLNFATNWQKICDEYFRGDATRMRTTADGFGDFTHPTLQPRPFDTEKALEAFARAGFDKRGDDGILMNSDGQRLSITVSTGYKHFQDLLTIIKEEAAKCGVEYNLQVLDGTAGWKLVQEKKHEIHFSAFGVSAEMFPRYKDFYHSSRAYDKAFNADGSVNPDRQPKAQTNNLQVVASHDLDAMIEQYDNSEDVDEMIGLARMLEERIFDQASFIPGFVLPTYRIGYWRWRHYPDDFNVKLSSYAGEFWLSWMDEAAKEETLKAKRNGVSFEPSIVVYDQYKED